MPAKERVDISALPAPDSYDSLRHVFADLDRYRLIPRTHGYPDNVVRLWAPIDAVHEAIVAAVTQSRVSVCCSMFGWDDAGINDLFLEKLADEHVFVQLSLDSTQAQGKGEVPLIKKWSNVIGNSLSIGHSEFSAISHIKEFVLDGVLTIGGSTNLSTSGQSKQNNECYFMWDAVYAAETRARLDRIHDEQLGQMAAHRSKLLVDYAAKRIELTADERKKLLAGVVPDA